MLLLTGYRNFISPLLAPRCRFYPSCSAYALEAVVAKSDINILIPALRDQGASDILEIRLAVRRLSRCHPFHAGGLDPVPVPGRTPEGRKSPSRSQGS